MESIDTADVGLYKIDAKMYFAKYPTKFQTTTFTVEIIYCAVTDLQQQPVPYQFYNVYTPSFTFAASLFTQIPNCGYTLEYSIKLKDMNTGAYEPLPAWIVVNTSSLAFSVQTNEPAKVGIYQISIFGSVPITYMNPTLSEELIIILNVRNECELDEVTPSSSIGD